MSDPIVSIEMNLSDVRLLHDALAVLVRSSDEDVLFAYLGLQIAIAEKREQMSGRGSRGSRFVAGV